MTSQGIVWKPSVQEADKKLSGAVEVTALKLSAGGGAGAVAIYDSSDLNGCNPNSLRWFLDASTTDNDYNGLVGPLAFQKGVYAVVEQGQSANIVVCIAVKKYPANS